MDIMVFAASNTLVFFFSSSFLVSLLCSPPLISGELIAKSCSTTSNYTSTSTFESNLNSLLPSLTSNASASGFYNATYGDDPNRVYGLLLCRGDVTPDQCRKCASTASKDAIEACPKSKIVTIWEENCMLRYADVMFFSVLDNSTRLYQPNAENISDPNQFNQVLTKLLGNLSSAAVKGASTRLFATGDAKFSSVQRVYGLMQCTEDLSTRDCSLCLRGAIGDIPTCCEGRKGARVLRLSCNLRYEVYPFYQELDDAGAAPPLPSPTSIAAPPASAIVTGKELEDYFKRSVPMDKRKALRMNGSDQAVSDTELSTLITRISLKEPGQARKLSQLVGVVIFV
ncbi:hypothetical protein ACLOJK_039611 [Asimina triloba]